MENNINAKKPVSRGLFIAVAIVSVCSLLGLFLTIGFTVYTLYKSNKAESELKSDISEYSTANSSLNKQIEELSTKIDADSMAKADMSSKLQSLTADIQSLTAEVSSGKSEIANLTDENIQFWIADDMRTGDGVTDNFITNYVLFCAGDVVLLDVETQPDYGKNYIGKGKFSVSASKLKTDVAELVNNFKTAYTNEKTDGMEDFSALKIHVTINNYNIGTYENGVLTLTN